MNGCVAENAIHYNVVALRCKQEYGIVRKRNKTGAPACALVAATTNVQAPKHTETAKRTTQARGYKPQKAQEFQYKPKIQRRRRRYSVARGQSKDIKQTNRFDATTSIEVFCKEA